MNLEFSHSPRFAFWILSVVVLLCFQNCGKFVAESNELQSAVKGNDGLSQPSKIEYDYADLYDQLKTTAYNSSEFSIPSHSLVEQYSRGIQAANPLRASHPLSLNESLHIESPGDTSLHFLAKLDYQGIGRTVSHFQWLRYSLDSSGQLAKTVVASFALPFSLRTSDIDSAYTKNAKLYVVESGYWKNFVTVWTTSNLGKTWNSLSIKDSNLNTEWSFDQIVTINSKTYAIFTNWKFKTVRGYELDFNQNTFVFVSNFDNLKSGSVTLFDGATHLGKNETMALVSGRLNISHLESGQQMSCQIPASIQCTDANNCWAQIKEYQPNNVPSFMLIYSNVNGYKLIHYNTDCSTGAVLSVPDSYVTPLNADSYFSYSLRHEWSEHSSLSTHHPQIYSRYLFSTPASEEAIITEQSQTSPNEDVPFIKDVDETYRLGKYLFMINEVVARTDNDIEGLAIYGLVGLSHLQILDIDAGTMVTNFSPPLLPNDFEFKSDYLDSQVLSDGFSLLFYGTNVVQATRSRILTVLKDNVLTPISYFSWSISAQDPTVYFSIDVVQNKICVLVLDERIGALASSNTIYRTFDASTLRLLNEKSGSSLSNIGSNQDKSSVQLDCQNDQLIWSNASNRQTYSFFKLLANQKFDLPLLTGMEINTLKSWVSAQNVLNILTFSAANQEFLFYKYNLSNGISSSWDSPVHMRLPALPSELSGNYKLIVRTFDQDFFTKDADDTIRGIGGIDLTLLASDATTHQLVYVGLEINVQSENIQLIIPPLSLFPLITSPWSLSYVGFTATIDDRRYYVFSSNKAYPGSATGQAPQYNCNLAGTNCSGGFGVPARFKPARTLTRQGETSFLYLLETIPVVTKVRAN